MKTDVSKQVDLENYYAILGLTPGCTQTEIKKAFRDKAKKIHPDVSHDKHSAEERMRILLKAYEVILDPMTRQEYDRLHSRYFHTRFDYRRYLKVHKEDPWKRAKLIFYDLLHDLEDEAAELYVSAETFELERYLDTEDFMDCAFLLSEVLEKHGRYLSAYSLLKKIVILEREQPYFKHFFEEVIKRLHILVCMKMPVKIPHDTVLTALHELAQFEFSDKDTAVFLKKIAEIYTDLGKYDSAAVFLRRGLRLDRRLSGVKKLKMKIGFVD